ncbi:universal stress protein [Halovenus rubra]|uniref:Universal stress protein n=2 Tax=Halovenus rubra TaxID=869890 RepID=A0ABD5X700_9EURY|nr:universal stress protein [Halovenus rubra]
MYENILLPFDGSDGSTEILHHASEVAHWSDATIHVLYVADTARDSVTVVENDTIDVLVEKGYDIVEEAAKTLDTVGLSYETDVVQGNPAPTIVDYAERYDQDLVVMPTHGRTGLPRHLLGSVSEKVVRLSSVPVLTVRMQPDETLQFPYEHILIPTDGSDAATRAAKHTLSLAASSDATVHILSVVDDAALGLDVRSTVDSNESEQAATEAVEAIASEANARGITDITRHVEHGTPIETLLDCIESNDIHAVGMGTTGRQGTDRILFGSVAEKTVRSAPVPVVTIGEP